MSILTPEQVWPILAAKCDEAMARPIRGEYRENIAFAQGCDAVLIGPGLGRERHTDRLALSLLEELEGPVVVDADGINALAEHMDILDARPGGLHGAHPPRRGSLPGWGAICPTVTGWGRPGGFAAEHRCVLVLKGHRTITALARRAVLCQPHGQLGHGQGGLRRHTGRG